MQVGRKRTSVKFGCECIFLRNLIGNAGRAIRATRNSVSGIYKILKGSKKTSLTVHGIREPRYRKVQRKQNKAGFGIKQKVDTFKTWMTVDVELTVS